MSELLQVVIAWCSAIMPKRGELFQKGDWIVRAAQKL